MKRKIFNLVLIILAAFIFSPVIGHAQTENEYLVWVGDIQITDANKNDVLGDLDGNKATVIFIPASGDKEAKLILNDANIHEGHFDQARTTYSAIQSEIDMTIEIKGNNVLGKYSGEETGTDRDVDKYSVNYGILDEHKNLNFIGDGSLTIVDKTDGIFAKDITFDKDFGALTIEDDGRGVLLPPCAISSGGTVTIKGGNFYLTSIEKNGITANKVIINGGHIKIRTNPDKNTISSYDGIIIDDNIEVINAEYIKGTTNQLWVSNIDIDDGFVTIKGTKKNITFNSNGGSSVDSQEVSYGNKITKPTNPTKENYVFDGWYQDITLNVPFDFDTPIINDVTLYAKWTANEYNIIITVNDEDMGTASADLNKAIEGTNVSLTSLAKTGYHFVKWESEDVTITNNKFTMPAKNITIKAIFEEDEILTYRVSFDKNGGTGSMDDIAGLTGTYTLPENNFVAPDGKQFKGWSLSSDGEIVEELNLDEDKTVYAIWEDIPEDYSFEFKKGDKQELTIDNIDSFTFTIDGDYSLFDSLKIGNLDLIKDEDYIVTEGSTIITFTNKGIAKLNTLEKGTYEILVTYSNGKNVTGSLSLNKILPQEPDTPNSKTGDNISYYIIIGITSLLGLIGSAFYVRKKLY